MKKNLFKLTLILMLLILITACGESKVDEQTQIAIDSVEQYLNETYDNEFEFVEIGGVKDEETYKDYEIFYKALNEPQLEFVNEVRVSDDFERTYVDSHYVDEILEMKLEDKIFGQLRSELAGCRILGQIELGMTSNPDLVELRNEYANESIEEVYLRYSDTLRPIIEIVILNDFDYEKKHVIESMYKEVDLLNQWGEETIILKVICVSGNEIDKLSDIPEKGEATSDELMSLISQIGEKNISKYGFYLANPDLLSEVTVDVSSFEERAFYNY